MDREYSYLEYLNYLVECKDELIEYVWNTSGIFTLEEINNFYLKLDTNPLEVSFIVDIMGTDNVPTRALLKIMNNEEEFQKLLEFARKKIKKISKTKTKKLMYAMQDKEVSINVNLSSLTNYHSDLLYSVVKTANKEDLLTLGFKSKKYSR